MEIRSPRPKSPVYYVVETELDEESRFEGFETVVLAIGPVDLGLESGGF